jgi:hypothetical protein
VSRYAVKAVDEKKYVTAVVDMLPDFTADALAKQSIRTVL